MATGDMARVLLHGGADESFDQAVRFAGRLAREFKADLHVVYVVSEPLNAGFTAEMPTARLPELHAAVEEEARERLARLLPAELQERVTIAIRIGDTATELLRYAAEHPVDLAVVQGSDEHARRFVEHGRCSVLILRS
ncbi:MAG: universal stress protein [Acidobacteria bacterium]|nr:universal stress protein [Acidobacteriota bacterium]